jgi:hypothetical protein
MQAHFLLCSALGMKTCNFFIRRTAALALAIAFSARILIFLCYLLSCTLHHLKEYLLVGRSVETVPDNSFYSGVHKIHQTQVDVIELIGGFWMLYYSSPKNGGVTAVQNLILLPVKE